MTKGSNAPKKPTRPPMPEVKEPKDPFSPETLEFTITEGAGDMFDLLKEVDVSKTTSFTVHDKSGNVATYRRQEATDDELFEDVGYHTPVIIAGHTEDGLQFIKKNQSASDEDLVKTICSLLSWAFQRDPKILEKVLVLVKSGNGFFAAIPEDRLS